MRALHKSFEKGIKESKASVILDTSTVTVWILIWRPEVRITSPVLSTLLLALFQHECLPAALTFPQAFSHGCVVYYIQPKL